MPAWLSLVLTPLLPLLTLVVQEWIRSRQAEQANRLEKNKLMWERDVTKLDALEETVSSLISLGGYTPPDGLSQESIKKFEDLHAKLSYLSLGFPTYEKLDTDISVFVSAFMEIQDPYKIGMGKKKDRSATFRQLKDTGRAIVAKARSSLEEG